MNEPVYDRHGVQVHHGDCLNVLRAMPDCSVDAVVTDPPYGLSDHKPDAVVAALTAWATGDRERVPAAKGGFMGRDWDSFVPPPAVWDECPVAELDAQSGVTTSGSRKAGEHGLMGYMGADVAPMPAIVGDSGGASRFFPVFRWEAKASTAERPQVGGVSHPTVKPVDLMRWLVRLVTPPGGLVLDPFAGSGTTLHAARAEGMRAIGIERDVAYLPLIKARLDARPRTTSAAAGAKSDEPMDLLDLLEGGAA